MNDNSYEGGTRSPEYNDGLTSQQKAPGGMASGSTGNGDNTDGLGRDRTDAVHTDETGKLISADKVQGTAVYDGSGERIGTIDSLMINKHSGKVAYAVMSFGGFLGIGERYHPLPWDVLTYDEAKGGYNVQHSADALRSAPNYDRDELNTGGYDNDVDSYYGGPSTQSSTQSSTMPSSGMGTTGRSY